LRQTSAPTSEAAEVLRVERGYLAPSPPDGYRTVRTLRRGDDLPLAAIPGRAVPLARVLRPTK
jgi:hypothetical protein